MPESRLNLGQQRYLGLQDLARLSVEEHLTSYKRKMFVLVLAPILLLNPYASSQIVLFVHLQNSQECVTFTLFNSRTVVGQASAG